MTSAVLSPIEARAAVQKMIKASDRVAHSTARFYPSAVRPHYLALRALDMELLALRALPDPEVAAKHVDRWREIVADIFAASRGSTTASAPPSHPTAVALASAVLDPQVRSNRVGGLQESRLITLLGTRQRQLDPMPPTSIEEAEMIGDRTYGQIHRLSLDLLGIRSYPDNPAREGPAERLVSQLGKAIGLTYTLAHTPPSALGMPITPHKSVGSLFAAGAELGANAVAQPLDRRGLPLRVLFPAELMEQQRISPDQVMLFFHPTLMSKTTNRNPRATQDYAIGVHLEEITYTVLSRARDHLKDVRRYWKALKKGGPVPVSQLHAGDAAVAGPTAEIAQEKLARDQADAAAMQPIKLASSDLRALRGPLSEATWVVDYLNAVQSKSYFNLRERLLERHRLGKSWGLQGRLAWMNWTGRF